MQSLAFFALSAGESLVKNLSSSINFPHSPQKHLKHNSINGTYFKWITDLAKSILPGWPKHSFILPPQVLHLTPGSIAPSFKSIKPPSTGYPSILYNSGVTIFADESLLICSGLSKVKFNAPIFFLIGFILFF